MTREELEAALYSYYNQWDLQDAIRRLNGIKDTYNSLFDTGGAINYDGMPHGTTPGNPPLEAVCTAEKKLPAIYYDYLAAKKELEWISRRNRIIETALHKLNTDEAEVIHYRYCEGWHYLKQIAIHVHYSEKTVGRRLEGALAKILNEFESCP